MKGLDLILEELDEGLIEALTLHLRRIYENLFNLSDLKKKESESKAEILRALCNIMIILTERIVKRVKEVKRNE